MSKPGPDFYDDNSVFETYLAHRHNPANPNDTLESPVITALVGPVADFDVLDVGCGSAGYGRILLENGAKSYLGIDGSKNMIAASEQVLAGLAGRTILATIEDYEYPPGRFDLVVSRLALHYIANLELLFQKLIKTLRPGGRLIFSVEHPVITSHNNLLPEQRRSNWTVDDYFVTGRRETDWLGGRVVKFHHTVEDYFLALQGVGFVVESLRESRPDRTNFADEQEYERRRRIPLFLFLAARKPE